MPSDPETSVLVPSGTQSPTYESDSSLMDQLNLNFDENTPFWVPFLFKAFDSLKKDIQTNVFSLRKLNL